MFFVASAVIFPLFGEPALLLEALEEPPASVNHIASSIRFRKKLANAPLPVVTAAEALLGMVALGEFGGRIATHAKERYGGH